MTQLDELSRRAPWVVSSTFFCSRSDVSFSGRHSESILGIPASDRASLVLVIERKRESRPLDSRPPGLCTAPRRERPTGPFFAESTTKPATTPRAKKRGPPCPLEANGHPPLQEAQASSHPPLQEAQASSHPPLQEAQVNSHPPPQEASAREVSERRLDPGVAYLPWRLTPIDFVRPDRPPTDPRPRPTVSRGTQTEGSASPPSPPVRTPTKPLTPGRSKQRSPTKPLTPGRPRGPSIRTFRTPSRQPATPSKRPRPSESPGRFADLLRAAGTGVAGPQPIENGHLNPAATDSTIPAQAIRAGPDEGPI
ncbi:PREDICTED: proline-rich receptor-like protein kinase PERK9 [Wasmannia auropunctata]|uniref:proline-rich receptor-like protein kinase PERK9 n=1 Tax=Wasmannia auropunctata TaxID=64793 RepID=UPI0005F0A21F|nr:PREDICTED: proline-rich receptor-like protein kinase PERK9 [Wasmannia auropunctata]